ncbi:MAG TPA: amidohydrolase family protein [Chloroflexota bacterium]|nr:amidohydrolase family protein [Chloroflexota bacterium]
MRVIDSHFHWWPKSVFAANVGRSGYPRAEKQANGDYVYEFKAGAMRGAGRFTANDEWSNLEGQLEHMDSVHRGMGVLCSTGPFGVHFSGLPAAEGRDQSMLWNEEMAGAQRKYPGTLWATGVMPLQETEMSLEVMDHAINKLGLYGMNLPCSIGFDPRIDADRLEPVYALAEKLDVPLFLHPTDQIFDEMLGKEYNGAMYMSLGRVIEVSVAAYRLVLSGMMERHPNLKIVMSHTGGALPYQSGRMDKNSKAAELPKDPSVYIRRMYTDTVSPHALGVKFAVDYYGVDHVLYGSDYPCWNPTAALRVFDEAGLSEADAEQILSGNVIRLFKLKGATPAPEKELVAV